MAWLPSHQELRTHPKTKKAARLASVSLPAMIGHLHMLWWWALDHAPDGNLGPFDDGDLADAAEWDGDPAVFVAALTDCGLRGGHGFLEPDRRLHDWEEYGGKYRRRSEAGQKAAAARWAKRPSDQGEHANASPSESDRTATAEPTQCEVDAERNAEERRGEEITPPTPPETNDCDRNATASGEVEDPRVAHALTLVASRRAQGRPPTSRYVQRITEKLRTEEALDVDAARLCADYPDAPADLIAAALAGEDARNLAHFRRRTSSDPPPERNPAAAAAAVADLRARLTCKETA